jgi:hypothetical protein
MALGGSSGLLLLLLVSWARGRCLAARPQRLEKNGLSTACPRSRAVRASLLPRVRVPLSSSVPAHRRHFQLGRRRRAPPGSRVFSLSKLPSFPLTLLAGVVSVHGGSSRRRRLAVIHGIVFWYYSSPLLTWYGSFHVRLCGRDIDSFLPSNRVSLMYQMLSV